MSYFAKVDQGVVIDVIVAEQEFINNKKDSIPGRWIQTYKNVGIPEKRYNYARVGYHYDEVQDAFYPPQPFSSWTLDANTFQWIAPVAYPTDGEEYEWNEETQSWDAVETE